ncbi:MAG TPA: TonB-dependent receptor [Gemmatimonadales bacterium]
MVRFAVPAAAVLLLFAGHPAVAGAQTGTIRGKVTSAAGAPLGAVSVTVDATVLRVITDDQGAYELRGVPTGANTLRVRILGYVPQVLRVSVATGEALHQDFVMAPQAIALAPVDVTIGSRGRHTAAEELAVPVDVFPAQVLAQQGQNETSQILAAVSPSVNFPHQSVTDATDIVRPFTLRGLSPDQTLVLVNGWRQHQMAVVNTFAYGMPAGSSGVDINTLPAAAIDRIEVLRDGASAQYGSDAIAGVVNLVLKEGKFDPFANVTSGRYHPNNYLDDGTTVDVNGGWGIGLGRGSLSLFGEFLDRQPTNRASADPFETAGTGLADSINSMGQVVIKRNPVPQPNYHWGDGLEKDVLTMANLRYPLNAAGTSELYAFGGYSSRDGAGQGYRRYDSSNRNWKQIYPLGYLPEFHPAVTDYSAAGGYRAVSGGWSVDLGASFGHSGFDYNLRNTLNESLGPCLNPAAPCAPGPDGILGTADDPGLANKTSFFAGRLQRDEFITAFNATKPMSLGFSSPVNVAVGVAYRREQYQITRGERASYINGGHRPQDSAGADGIWGTADDDSVPVGGSQVFAGFAPSDESNSTRSNVGAYLDLETNLTAKLFGNAAARFEHYSDFGSLLTGKLAFRYQPSSHVTLRAAGSTGFRAPGLGQIHFSKVVTNVISGQFVEVGVFPVSNPAAKLLGAKPLKEEKAGNLSAGLAVSPRNNLTITADVFQITITNRILLGATFGDTTTQRILRNAGFNNIGAVQYFTNGMDTRTRGLDLTGDLRAAAGAGVFQLTAAVNFTKNQITRVGPVPDTLKNSGITGIIDSVTYIATTEERPDWRATVTPQYTVGRFHVLGRASYYGKFASAQPGFCDLCRDSYGSKTLFDAEIGYQFDQVNLSLGVRNLFDTYPDSPSSTRIVDAPGTDTAKDFNNNFGTFPWAAASPFGYNGRFLYVRLETLLTR